MIALLLIALLAQVAAGGERIDRPALPGFVVGFAGKQGNETLIEQVPRGETVQAWTRMVTTQRFIGMVRTGTDARVLVGRVAQGWIRACPRGSAATPDAGRAGTIVWAAIRLDCPRNPATGKPETMFMRAFDGAADGYSVQVAFRRVPTREDERWARDYLAQTRLCGTGTGC